MNRRTSGRAAVAESPQQADPTRRQNGSATQAQRSQEPAYSRRYSINGGESVEVAVFAHEVDNGNNPFTAYSTGVKRSYKQDNEWKDTKFFSPHALPVVAFALTEAYRWISDRRDSASGPKD